MNPVPAVSQFLPFLAVSQSTPAGTMPFALSVAAMGEAPAAMLVADSGVRVGSDVAMPVADAPSPAPQNADAPAVPAAVLLASLDQSARAFPALPAAVSAPQSAKHVVIEARDEERGKPKEQGPDDGSETSAAMDPATPAPVPASAPVQIAAPVVVPMALPISLPVPAATPAPAALRTSLSQPIAATSTAPVAVPSAVPLDTSPAAATPATVTPSVATPPADTPSAAAPAEAVVTPDLAIARPALPGIAAVQDQAAPQPDVVTTAAESAKPLPVARSADSEPAQAPAAIATLIRALPVVDDKPVKPRLAPAAPLPVERQVAAVQVASVAAPQPLEIASAAPLAVTDADPVVAPIVAAPAKTVATADVAVDVADDASHSVVDATSTAPVLTSVVAQPLAGPSAAVAVSATQPAPAEVTSIDRQLDLARGDAWLDTLARDIVSSAEGNHRLRFGLSPEHLGKLDVEVTRGDAGMSIHMTTRSDEARAVIAAAQPRLVEELRLQGTRVASTDVSAQADPQSGHMPRPQHGAFIETAIEAAPSAASDTNTHKTADGRYA